MWPGFLMNPCTAKNTRKARKPRLYSYSTTERHVLLSTCATPEDFARWLSFGLSLHRDIVPRHCRGDGHPRQSPGVRVAAIRVLSDLGFSGVEAARAACSNSGRSGKPVAKRVFWGFGMLGVGVSRGVQGSKSRVTRLRAA